MSHPILGLPPAQPTPLAVTADALVARRDAIAARALEIAVGMDETLTQRHDAVALRALQADAAVHLDKLAEALRTGNMELFARWAETLVPVYRRRRVQMDDFWALLEATRTAALETLASALGGPAMEAAQPTLDDAVDLAARRLDHFRRISGDARKQDPLVRFIYKGA